MVNNSHRGNLELVRQLAGRGHAGAEYYMALVYYYGQDGVERNFDVAEEWLNKSAEQDYELAIAMLARIAAKARELEVREVEAELPNELLQRLGNSRRKAETSFLSSQGFLSCVIVFLLLSVGGAGGWFYFNFVKVDSFALEMEAGVSAYNRADYGTAYNIWLPLAQGGHAGAQASLGAMYLSGNGVSQSFMLAYGWSELSRRNGGEYVDLVLDLAEGRMDSGELGEAKSFVEDCLKNNYEGCR